MEIRSSCFVTMGTQGDRESVHIFVRIILAKFVKGKHLNILIRP